MVIANWHIQAKHCYNGCPTRVLHSRYKSTQILANNHIKIIIVFTKTDNCAPHATGSTQAVQTTLE